MSYLINSIYYIFLLYFVLFMVCPILSWTSRLLDWHWDNYCWACVYAVLDNTINRITYTQQMLWYDQNTIKTSSVLLALGEGNSTVTGALMLSLICAWTNGWANNRDAGDLKRNHTHYDIAVIHAHISCNILNMAMRSYWLLIFHQHVLF